jgi:hypothetical protein
MVIISADSDLFKFTQFIKKDTGAHLSVLSYNTETGEGVMAGTQRERLNKEGFIHRVFDTDNTGKPVRSHFKVEPGDILVKIIIPYTQYLNDNIKNQAFNISSDPQNDDKIEVSWVVEKVQKGNYGRKEKD